MLTEQFLRRATDRGVPCAGRRFTDNRPTCRSVGRSLRRSLDTLHWYEVWAMIIHTALLLLHAFVVIGSLIAH